MSTACSTDRTAHRTTDRVAEPRQPAAEPVLPDELRQPCEVWTRVMGYHRPVSSFNIGKRGEHAERTFFAECRRSDG